MKRYIYYSILLLFFVACKDKSLINNDYHDSLEKNKLEKANIIKTNFMINDVSYLTDSLSCVGVHDNKLNKEIISVTIFITQAIKIEKQTSTIDYAYLKINCELQQGDYFFTEIGNETLPNMEYVIKNTKGTLNVNTPRLDKEGKFSKISILNFTNSDQPFDLDCYFPIRIDMDSPPKRVKLQISNIVL